MREFDKPDIPGLGAKIEKRKPDAEPRKVSEGVFKDPDGRFRTVIPGNEAANKPDTP